MWSSKWNFAPKKLKVHDNKKIVVLGLKIDGKIWPIQKCSEAEKLTSKKKKLVERKRKLISASTGCNRAYPYMASQEVLLLEYGNVRISPRRNFYVRISTSCKQWLATCILLVLYKKSSTRSSTTWATCRDKKMSRTDMAGNITFTDKETCMHACNYKSDTVISEKSEKTKIFIQP